MGNWGYLAATPSRSAARWRCCHSGVRWSGRRLGNSNDRAADSRNAEANAAVDGRAATTSASASSGSIISSSSGSSSTASGRRMTMPSSAHITSTAPSPSSSSQRSARRWRSATAQGACTRPPNGDSTQMRQSPISSRNRSTTIVRSSGTTRWPRPDRRGSRAGCRWPTRPALPPAGGRRPRFAWRSASRARTRRPPGPVPRGGRARRRARTASCRAHRGPG
jgi:hypothetical protein